MNVIETEGVVKTYRGKRGARVEALKGVNLSVSQGEVFGFLGPNGAGKSTTIKVLMGLISPTGGSARIMGRDVREPAARKKVGYLPENPAFYDYLSAQEYLTFVGGVYGMEPSRLKERSEEVLQRLDLWEARKRPVRSYSKGMVQRLGLAQTMIHDPDLYVLDEPMSGLDPVGRALVKDLLLEFRREGKTVFFSTHVTADVEEVCDRVGIIKGGNLVRVERISDILSGSVESYHLFYRLKGSEEESQRSVLPTELPGAIASIEREGGELRLVEPRRRNLEDFFLEVVKGA